MKRASKPKTGKVPRAVPVKLLKPVDSIRLEQPLQTALHAKLWRLGYRG